MLRQFTSFILSFLGIFIAYSQSIAINKLTQDQALRNANIGLVVKSLTSQETIVQYNPNRVITPASLLKLLTTATALRVLSSDFRFSTSFCINGNVDKNGILQGNLYVVGGGDPTLGSIYVPKDNFLKKVIKHLKNRGIVSINGNIVIDESIFSVENVSRKWLWEDIGNYYATPAQGAAYRDNRYIVTFQSGEVGSTPQIVDITPHLPQLTFINEVKSANISYDNAYIFGAPFDDKRIIRGEIPAHKTKFSIKGAMPNAGYVLAEELVQEMEKESIFIRGNISFDVCPNNSTTVYTHHSIPLSEVVKIINKQSNNMYAQQLFRFLGVRKKHKLATLQSAIGVLTQLWQSAIPTGQLIVYDGCGLSPFNAISANATVAILSEMYRSKNREAFVTSLPLAGKEGTVRYFLKNTSLAGKVRVKSGTMQGTKAYSGYLFLPNETLTFAILTQNYLGKSRDITHKIEKFLLEVADEYTRRTDR